MFDDIGEANQNRQRNPAPAQRVDQLFQIDGAIRFFGWVNKQMAVLPDREISFAPAGDVIELRGVGGGPAIGWFPNLSADAGDLSGQFGGLLVQQFQTQLEHGKQLREVSSH